MKALRLVFLFLTLTIYSNAQLSIDTAGVLIYDSTTNSYTDWSQYVGQMDTITSSTLIFDSISPNDFGVYKKKYHPKIDLDSSRATWTDTSFSIQTEISKLFYTTKVTDDNPYNYYLGFLEPLNLYLVSSIDGKNEMGTLLFIDGKTGKTFFSGSPYDYPCEAPVISPKNKYLLSYSNNWYEHNLCFLSILTIDKNKRHFKLQGFIAEEINQWTITEIVWINDNSFALLVKENIDPSNYDRDSGVDHYLKVSISEKKPLNRLPAN